MRKMMNQNPFLFPNLDWEPNFAFVPSSHFASYTIEFVGYEFYEAIQ